MSGTTDMGGAGGPSVTWLLCSYNRREATLHALSRVHEQQGVTAAVAVVLVDDNSADGTAEAVRARYPDVVVHSGSGSLFWGLAMALAQDLATASSAPDFLCWLNDDVDLHLDALRILLDCSGEFGDRAVVVGALTDPDTSAITYSGFRRVGRRPKQLAVVDPTGRAQEVDAVNGNLVLVPRAVYRCIGGIDPAYRHRFGDVDYAYRAARSGFPVVLAPAPLGSCSRNSAAGTWEDASLPVRRRLRDLFSAKCMPIRSTVTFDYRHAGPAGPLYSLGSYARALSTIAATRTRTRPLRRAHGRGRSHPVS